MTKQELLDAVSAKKGFHSIIKDEVAPDNVQGDPIEKRFLYVNHINSSGTAGKTFVYYLHDTANDVAWFYNVEPEAVDNVEPPADQKKFDALAGYLKANFDAYFIVRSSTDNNWAQADVFTASNGQLVKSQVLVFKKGNNPLNHLTIV